MTWQKTSKRRIFKQVLVILLFLSFCTCFLLQVWGQVVKFLGKATVSIVREETDPELRYCTVLNWLLLGIYN